MAVGASSLRATVQLLDHQKSASTSLPAAALSLSTPLSVASLTSLFTSLVSPAPQPVSPGGQPANQLVTGQIPRPVICLEARVGPVGTRIAGQDSEEVACAYYVDTPSEDEEGATAEALVANKLEDLELLFQEQLAVFAKDAAEQHTLKKGKAMATDPSLPQDHSPIMVIEEELEAASTRPDELITSQYEDGSRWFVRHMPCTSGTSGGST